MNHILSKILLLGLMASFIPAASAVSDDFECGEWDDVPGIYMEAITDICEKQIMSGNTTNYFGSDVGINRAEAATVGNRILMGSDDYNGLENSGVFYTNALDNHFTDLPPNETWNEWLLKAMYYSFENNIMTGDESDSSRTTYRPTDDVTTAEFLKILYESAKEGNRLDTEYDEYISYNGNPWYEEIVTHYYDIGLLSNYDVENTKFIEFKVYYNSDDETDYHNINLELDEEITRRDVAFLVYEMLRRDIMSNPNEHGLGELGE